MAKAFLLIKKYPDFDRLSEYTPLVSQQDAELLIQVCEADSRLGPKEAHDQAQALMGFFLTREAIDPAQFTLGVSQLFQSYHRGFVKRVVDPVAGLPSKEKWLPAIAVIKEALEAEKIARANILSKAQWTLKEIERRKAKAIEDAKYAGIDWEDRRKRAEQVMQNFRTGIQAA